MTTTPNPQSAEELAAGLDDLAVKFDAFSLAHSTVRQAAAALRASAQQEPTEFRAVGWIRPDGSMHKGCPPLNEPDGWSALLVQEKQPTMLNGLTEAETNATASVAGLTKRPEGDAQEAAKLAVALDALDEIALAGMSGTGQESEEGMRAWHARRAREFIGIAARAKSAIAEMGASK